MIFSIKQCGFLYMVFPRRWEKHSCVQFNACTIVLLLAVCYFVFPPFLMTGSSLEHFVYVFQTYDVYKGVNLKCMYIVPCERLQGLNYYSSLVDPPFAYVHHVTMSLWCWGSDCVIFWLRCVILYIWVLLFLTPILLTVFYFSVIYFNKWHISLQHDVICFCLFIKKQAQSFGRRTKEHK